MKKGIIITIILGLIACPLVIQGIKSISNNAKESEASSFDISDTAKAVTEKSEEKIIENNIEEKNVEEIEINEKTIEEVVKNEETNKEEKVKEKQDNKERNNKEVVNKEEKQQTQSEQQINKQNDDEFFDTSDRDPFAEEQHKSNVPLVLIDKDGNEMQPETVYWDEERGQGTLDPSGYIPEGLPPGAVFVTEITPEEEARLREEFNVE